MKFPVAFKINKFRLLWTKNQSGYQRKDAVYNLLPAGLSAACLQSEDTVALGRRATQLNEVPGP